MKELGINVDPRLSKRPPANVTPKQLLSRYNRLYQTVIYLSLASSYRVDRWEYYAARAIVFEEMHEYDLAWQDCMRCIALVDSGYTSISPLNEYVS